MRKRLMLGIIALVFIAIALTGCKATEPFKDADVQGRNTDPAELVTFPDGFSNVATKCDHGNRIYSAFHGDSAYGAVGVVPHDPTC